MTYLKKPNILRLKIKETDNTCKKVYFATQQFADDYIKKLQRTSSRDVMPVESYLCSICSCWHLTSWTSPDIKKEFDQINAELEATEEMINRHIKIINDLVDKIKYENQGLKIENFNLKNELTKKFKS